MIIYYSGKKSLTFNQNTVYIAFCLKYNKRIRGRIVLSNTERKLLGIDEWTIKYHNSEFIFANLKHVFIATRCGYAN